MLPPTNADMVAGKQIGDLRDLAVGERQIAEVTLLAARLVLPVANGGSGHDRVLVLA